MNRHLKCLTHVTLKCIELEPMVAFYRDALGLRELFTLHYDEGLVTRMGQQGRRRAGDKWITYFKVGERKFIELFNEVYDKPREPGQISFARFSLSVEDVGQAAGELLAKGVALRTAGGEPLRDPAQIAQAPGGGRAVLLRDPEGNEIELVERAADSPRGRG